ncbi:MAG: ferrous iron transport protein B [Armatimonadetes bacterium]|nr:ferrous iron transport protein B [Armatimonadota bacterium]
MSRSVAGRQRTALVALVGNPNSGKTSLFNALTGSNQKVGNYPGVTVERVSGRMPLGEGFAEVIDVPGLYSMRAVSLDEEVATEVISGVAEEGEPDVLVCVIDASHLERNLFFFSQLVGAQIPTVVALTMTDILKSEGHFVDTERLASALGVEVVPVTSHKNLGLDNLKLAIERTLAENIKPEVDLGFPNVVREPVFRLHERLARAGVDVTKSSVREALLDENAPLNRRIKDLPEFKTAFDEERAKILGETAQGKTIDAQSRYAWAGRIKAEVSQNPNQLSRGTSDRIDAFLTHRVFGPLFFFLVMYLVFQSIYTLATPLMDLIGSGIDAVKGGIAPLLERWPLVQSLVVDGVVTGIGTVLTFLPQILILFFFIALLEGSGYLARAAFLMDRMLGWCGLNGRAFIPLLSSFACAVPGIMAARVMPDQRSRLATVLVAPLMSCSARLPVYVLFIGAFVEPRFGPAWAGFALFLMHFVGLVFAVPTVWLLNKGVLKGRRLPFVLELPRYQWPRARDVLVSLVSRAKVFLNTAGTIIFFLSIVIWGLLYFPRSDQADLSYRAQYTQSHPSATTDELSKYVDARRIQDSYLGRFGRTIEPVFIPAGFDWRLTTAILAAFPAREVVVSAMGIIFDLGGDIDEKSPDLRKALAKATWPDGRPLVTLPTAISLMVFFALCAQCMATLATIKRESGSWKWAAYAFLYMTALAYGSAVVIYQIGSRLT